MKIVFRHSTMASMVVLSSLGLLTGTADAATYNVTGTADDGSGVVTGGPDTFEATTLRAAVNAANTNPGADTIELPAGTYTLSGAEGGALDITDALTIRGSDRSSTIIESGDPDRVLVFTSAASPSRLEGVTIQNGQAPALLADTPMRGGGIYSEADLTLTDCAIRNNKATGVEDGAQAKLAEGGGLYALNADLVIDGCLIQNNIAQGGEVRSSSAPGGDARGGGIYQVSGGLTISNSAIAGNAAYGGFGPYGGGNSEGGGLHHYGGAFNGGVVLINLTVSGNSTSGGNFNSPGTGLGDARGGGLYLSNSGASISNTTITLNSAAFGSFQAGGGIYNTDGSIALQSTLVAGNTAGTEPDIYRLSAVVSLGANLIGIAGAEGGIDFPLPSSDQQGSSATPIEPLLDTLADNGGNTLTHALLAGSPALNAGSNNENLAFDQRGEGFPRVQGGQADVGAFEVDPLIFRDGFEVAQDGDG